MHAGLGTHAGSTLIVEPGINAATTAELEAAVAQALIGSAAIPAAYSVRGSLGAALPRLLPGVDLKFVLQEIGTWSSMHVLHALRDAVEILEGTGLDASIQRAAIAKATGGAA